jgi:hypothetical protein
MTGMFYLLGGASFQGYDTALGLRYLADRQSAEYIFAGAQVLLVISYVLVSVFAFILVFFWMKILPWLSKRIRRDWEFVFFWLIVPLNVLIFVFADHTLDDCRGLITRGACLPYRESGGGSDDAILGFLWHGTCFRPWFFPFPTEALSRYGSGLGYCCFCPLPLSLRTDLRCSNSIWNISDCGSRQHLSSITLRSQIARAGR